MKRVAMAVGVVLGLWGVSAAAEQNEPVEPETPGYAQPPPVYIEPAASKRGMEVPGVMVTAGGGVEGFTGDMGGAIQPGVAWGATAGVEGIARYFGGELAYSGAVHEFDLNTDSSGGSGSGSDIVRNGAHAALTVGYPAKFLEPYVLAGMGFETYAVRNPIPGFFDDTIGYVPLAGGLRFQQKAFTVDARFGFNVLFANEFAVETTALGLPLFEDSQGGTRWDGMIRLGAVF